MHSVTNGTSRKRRASTLARVSALLMVIGVAACDNVEWGGMDVAIVPPPPKTAPVGAAIETGDRLPRGPVLYHVTRDSLGTTMTPVGMVIDQELEPIEVGDQPEVFGERFITGFLSRPLPWCRGVSSLAGSGAASIRASPPVPLSIAPGRDRSARRGLPVGSPRRAGPVRAPAGRAYRPSPTTRS